MTASASTGGTSFSFRRITPYELASRLTRDWMSVASGLQTHSVAALGAKSAMGTAIATATRPTPAGSHLIAGLKLGADDYVTKPFALEELMARVEAVIRRHRGKGGSRLAGGDVVVDLSEGRATRGDRELGLTGIEFRILAALMRSSGQLVTYAKLAEAVWAVTTGPESNSLEVHISRIRQKLEQDGGSRLIQTVRGLGYRFSAEQGQ